MNDRIAPAPGRSLTAASATHALSDLLARFGGRCDIDPERRVTGFATLSEAGPEQLAFVSDSRYRDDVKVSRAAAVLVTQADADALVEAEREPVGVARRLWICADPYLQFARMSQWFEAAAVPESPAGRSPHAIVDDEAVVDATASIGAGAVIGRGVRIGARVRIGAGSVVGEGSTIGDDCLLHAHVVVYAGCGLGARCIVHSGAVIGADGFGFAKDQAAWVKIPQVGGVVIGDDVEIGANTTIDRGTLDDTRIGNGVKLDNQIQIAHNVEVGEHTIMAACVGIAGSAVIGRRCMIGGAARIMGHVTIADDTVISTQTFVSRSITKAAQYTGYYPMAEHAAFEKSAAVLRRLDRLRDRVRRLEAAMRVPPDRDPFQPEGIE